ncbi:HAMP domain-containing histidine kinase [Streptomyces sp. HU2014]|uniref:sensor histidine kinase n=1 Tax=Streptomyces sp. HU2014 TaxID=2939414 RepID=UPI00200C893F|nr:HAMP domain-containing sensor histidine kinase [Streptomyces sp. HU2014]UQI46174.1 HAMP domain-containing histidine kinase [Streptomyces sp. HU2014]
MPDPVLRLPGRTFPWWARLPTRARTALAAGAAALVLAGAGAWWLHHDIYATQMTAARSRALAQSRAVSAEFARIQARDREATSDVIDLWPVIIIGPSGPFASWLPQAFPDAAGTLPPAPASAKPGWGTFVPVHFGTPASSCRQGPSRTASGQPVTDCLSKASALAGQTLDMAGTSVEIHTADAPAPSAAPAGRYTVYVAATRTEAAQAADALLPALAGAVPLAALIVALSAWVATTRALRPIEAIRARLATVDQPGAGTRVPVPAAEDEITRLARTTNDTLDILDAHARRQRRFIADAAHELRSPVTGLRATLEVALNHPRRPGALSNALQAATRLQHLVEDLLTLARLDNTPTPPATTTRVNLTDLVRELLLEIPHTQPGATAQLTLQAPDGPLDVPGDRDQLRRLLRNLLDNAARHAGTQVTVTLDSRPGWVECTVHNDGDPIPEADRERIFERFTRLDEARTRDTGGSGLGLAIARDIAHHHRGTLTATPTGEGASFLLRLPG